MTDKPEEKLRTWVIAFQADDAAAETAAVVVGAVLDNFRGLTPVEFTDETSLAEPDGTAMDVLHSVLTAADRLSATQKSMISDFIAAVDAWECSERGDDG